ncbi:MAG: hypothetical protein AB8G96_05785 [Phycisphaerales bacterium]
MSGAGDPKGGGPATLPTTSADFFQDGTQPQPDNPDFAPAGISTQCQVCHSNYDLEVEPWRPWRSSMLAQSARDPIFWAALTIANQDAVGAGEFCIRCHAPNAFLNGHAEAADDDDFGPEDFDGVNCNFCHRVVDPEFKEGVSPAQDETILAELDAAGLIPAEGSNARYVVDPRDDRRGPFDDLPFNPHPAGAEVVVSPFHSTSELCWTCHDVSNPLMELNEDGDGYTLGPIAQAHVSGSQDGQFPLHRTYSEWKNSYYSTIGVQHNGRFGGNHPTGVMNSCQDCHMPDMEGFGCSIPGFPERPDVPQHSFLGANTWVLRAVDSLFPESETGLNPELVDTGIARNLDMLSRASDLTVSQSGATLSTRLINRSGHKLPTGFPDGRRIWFNVKFLRPNGTIVAERGAYDFDTGTLIEGGDDTTVIEAAFGIGEELALELGRPAGKTFHFALANEVIKDNRIPPAGWSAVLAEQQQMGPVGATFGNGQHWMDLDWEIPFEADRVVVTTYYQTTTREFIEFLRDANVTDDRGTLAYDLWTNFGGAEPAVLDMVEMQLANPADVTGDGLLTFDDLLTLLSAYGECDSDPAVPCITDLDGSGSTDFADLLIMLSYFAQPG